MIRNNPNNDVDLSPVINLLNELKSNYNGHSIFKDYGTLYETNLIMVDDVLTHTDNKMNLYSISKNVNFTIDAFNTITFNPLGLITSFASTQDILNSSTGLYSLTYKSAYSSMENQVINNFDNVGIYPWTNKNYNEYIVKYYTNIAIAESIPNLREYNFKSLTQYFEQLMLAHSVNINWNDKLNELDEFCFVDATSTFTIYDESFNIHLNSNNLIKSVKITNSNNPCVGLADVKALNMTYNNFMPSGINILLFENCDVENFVMDGCFNIIRSTTTPAKIQNATFNLSQSTSNLPISYLNIQNLTLNNITNNFNYCSLGNVDFCGIGSHNFANLSLFDNACFSNFKTVHFNQYTAPNASLTVKDGDIAIFDANACQLNELSVENLSTVNFSLNSNWNPSKIICNSVKSLTFNNLAEKPPMTVKSCASVKFVDGNSGYIATYQNCSFDSIETLNFTNFVLSSCSINDIRHLDLNNGTFSYCNMNNISGNGAGSVVVNHPSIEDELNIHSFGNLTLSSISHNDKTINLYNMGNVKIQNGKFNGLNAHNVNILNVSTATLTAPSFDNVNYVGLLKSALISDGLNLDIKTLSGTGNNATIKNIENLKIDSLYSASKIIIEDITNLTINDASYCANNNMRNVSNGYFKVLPLGFDNGMSVNSWHISNLSYSYINWINNNYMSVDSMTMYTGSNGWFGSLNTFIGDNLFVAPNSGNYTFKNVNDITINNMLFGGSNQLLFSSFNNLNIGNIASNANESLIISGANHNNITINNFENLKNMKLINNNQIKLNSGSVHDLTVSNSSIGGSLTLSNLSLYSGNFKNLSFADFGNGRCIGITISNVSSCINPFSYCDEVYIDAAHSSVLRNYVLAWAESYIA